MAQRRGCSPWAWAGCGCGFIAMVGIACVFGLLLVQRMAAKRNPAEDPRLTAACQSQLRYLGVALENYRHDHGTLPATLAALNPTYLLDPIVLRCPLERRGIGKPYQYVPTAARPADAMVTCRNHQQGPLILQRNGKLRVTE